MAWALLASAFCADARNVVAGEVGYITTGDPVYWLSAGHIRDQFALTAILGQDVEGDPELTLAQLAWTPARTFGLYFGRTALSLGATTVTTSSFVTPPSRPLTTSDTVKAYQRALLRPDFAASADWSPAQGHYLSLTVFRQSVLVVEQEGGQTFFLDTNTDTGDLDDGPHDPTRPTGGRADAFVDGVLAPIAGPLAGVLIGGDPFSRPEVIVSAREEVTRSYQVRYEHTGLDMSLSADAASIETASASLALFSTAFRTSIYNLGLVGEVIGAQGVGAIGTIGFEWPMLGFELFGHYTRVLDGASGEESAIGLLLRLQHAAIRAAMQRVDGDFYSRAATLGTLSASIRF